MIIRCVQCHTPFPMNREQVLAALDEVHREGYKHYNAQCPRCGRMNAVPQRQLMLWGQGWTPPADSGKPAEKAAPKEKAAKPAPAKKEPAKQPAAKAPAKGAASKPAEKTAKEAPSTRKKLSSFELNARTLGALEEGGVTTVAAALKKLEEGKDAVTAIKGIGPAGYDEIRKVLKKAGYTLPK